MDQIFQARATLQSLVENFPMESVKRAAQNKLREIEEAEAERQRMLDADTLQTDTLQINR